MHIRTLTVSAHYSCSHLAKVTQAQSLWVHSRPPPLQLQTTCQGTPSILHPRTTQPIPDSPSADPSGHHPHKAPGNLWPVPTLAPAALPGCQAECCRIPHLCPHKLHLSCWVLPAVTAPGSPSLHPLKLQLSCQGTLWAKRPGAPSLCPCQLQLSCWGVLQAESPRTALAHVHLCSSHLTRSALAQSALGPLVPANHSSSHPIKVTRHTQCTEG